MLFIPVSLWAALALASDSGGGCPFPCSAAAPHGSRWTVFCCLVLCGRALNMMMLSAVFGILIAHIYNELFYICILIGFIISLLLLRYVLSYASGRSEVELGQAAMIGGLLLLAFSNSLMNSYIAGVLLGTGIGTTVSRFLYKDD